MNAPVTYAEFLDVCKAFQRDYINEERARYTAAAFLAPAFRRADGWGIEGGDREGFAALGLHRLTTNDIADRLVQLDDMENRIDKTHGDNPLMKWTYETQCPGGVPTDRLREAWAKLRAAS